MKSIELPADKRCYTIGDLQTILGVNRGSVYKLLDRKEFYWIKLGTTYRIPKQSFEDWLGGKI